MCRRTEKPWISATNNIGNVPLRSQTIQMTKVFRPRAAEVTNVANILTQALTRKLPNGQIVSTASISQDLASQSVVVSGSRSGGKTSESRETNSKTGGGFQEVAAIG